MMQLRLVSTRLYLLSARILKKNSKKLLVIELQESAMIIDPKEMVISIEEKIGVISKGEKDILFKKQDIRRIKE